MRRLSLRVLSLAVMLGMAMAARAGNTIVFTDSPGPESSMSSVGTGIYTGTLNGVTTSFICDDDYNDVSKGQSWNVYEYTLSGASDVATPGHGLFSGSPAPYTASGAGITPSPSIQSDYDAVAYLADQLLSYAVPASDSAQINAIQWAIWAIMDHPSKEGITEPTAGSGCTATSGNSVDCGGYWVNYALTNEASYSNPNIVFYTPVLSGSKDCGTPTGQEWIGLTSTPEPFSMLLMGTFLTLAGGLLGRKRRTH